MEITTEVVKQLRDRTGISVMQCRKALEEAGGDIEQAVVILAKKSAGAAEKKADRELAAGAIGTYVHDGAIGAMVLLSSETDFVSRNPEFGALAKEIAMHVAAANPAYLSMNDVPEDKKTAALSVFEKEVEGKPEDMKAKILEGKLASYFKDQVLLEQPFIKDDSKTIKDLVAEATQKFGERVEVSNFSRMSAR
ncbi:MAG: elongation factor Ts [Candidatus Pacebacteria bacterium]|nr:elongation factor Ts [Candidatus Paceibacterota bacterium]MBP9840778.1 elongation factor Ts [Candidatus Paceibacterota bacterium]